jgi:hypothetical protein
VPVAERRGIGEADPRQVDGAAPGQVARQRQQDAGHIPVGTVVNQDDHRVRAGERAGADDEE